MLDKSRSSSTLAKAGQQQFQENKPDSSQKSLNANKTQNAATKDQNLNPI